MLHSTFNQPFAFDKMASSFVSTVSSFGAASAASCAASAAPSDSTAILEMAKGLPGWESAKKFREMILTQHGQGFYHVSGQTGSGKTIGMTFMLSATNLAARLRALKNLRTGKTDKCFTFVMCVPTTLAANALFRRVFEMQNQLASSHPELKCGLANVGVRAGGEGIKSFDGLDVVICTTQVLTNYLRQLCDRSPTDFETALMQHHFIIDEAHQNTTENNILLALLNYMMRKDLQLSMTLMSATMPDFGAMGYESLAIPDAEPLVAQKKNIFSRKHVWAPEEIHDSGCFDGKMEPIYSAVMDCARGATENGYGNKILIFVDGSKTATELQKLCSAAYQGKNIYFLSSESTPDEQKMMFDSEDCIIIATNIAESSVTIPKIQCVIDTGLVRVSIFDQSTETDRLETVEVSQDAATQRWGRTGRDCDGIVYCLYTQRHFANLAPHATPAIFNTDIVPIVLDLLSMTDPVNQQHPLPVEHILRIPQEKYEEYMEFFHRADLLNAQGFTNDRGFMLTKIMRTGVPVNLAAMALRCSELDGPEFINALHVIAHAAIRSNIPTMVVIPDRIKKNCADFYQQRNVFEEKMAPSFFSDQNTVQGVVKCGLLYLSARDKKAFCTQNWVNYKYFSAFERCLRNLSGLLARNANICSKDTSKYLFDAIQANTNFNPSLVHLSSGLFPVFDRDNGSNWFLERKAGSKSGAGGWQRDMFGFTRWEHSQHHDNVIPLVRSQVVTYSKDGKRNVKSYISMYLVEC